MKRNRLLIGLFFFTFLTACSSPWKKIATDFQQMPAAMRPAPLWFWNNSTVEPEELRQQMCDFKKAGYGGLSILPFGRDFKPKYLTDEYFEVYRVCMEEAANLNLRLCIYDEYGFPSGTAGDINGDGIGRFKQKYPHLTNKRLDKTEFTVSPGTTFQTEIDSTYLMAVVSMDMLTFQRIDLTEFIDNGVLTWNVPQGTWKVMAFHCVDAGNSIIDYLSPEAADLYIAMTHEEYYKRFSKYFGTVIEGTFFDEPTMYYANGRTWTPDFNKKFELTYGFCPALYYPALWYDIGQETTEARNYLFGFRSQLFAEGYINKVNRWSAKHGVHATGHLDNEEKVNAVGTSGDFMKAFKYLNIPGIDKIGGNRPAEKFYKLTASAAYNWDHSYVMSETYGAMGNIGWNQLFGIAMDQYAKGINILIPHAVWYNTEKVTFLPELSLRNPIYADSLSVFNDYLTRLNVLMKNEGRWVGDIAVLYPIHAMESDHYLDGPLGYYRGGVEIPYLDYIDVSTILSDNLGYDHLFIHPEVLDERCSVEKGKLKLNNKIQYNSFSTLFIPSCKTISLTNLEKIKEFSDAGGQVIFTTQYPVRATLLKDDAKVKSLVKELATRENVYFVESPTKENLQAVLLQSKNEFALNFNWNPVRNTHKIVNQKNLWFLANPGHENISTEFTLNGEYDLEVWDPHTGIISREPVDLIRQKGRTLVKMDLPALRSLFLIEK